MPKKKETTIDDLARMVKGGFDEVGEQFYELHGEMNKRFEYVDKRFVEVNNRLDTIS